MNEQFKLFNTGIDPLLRKTVTQMLNLAPRKRPTEEKILSVMEKEYGEIKEGMEWKVEEKKLVIFVLGPIPDCYEKNNETQSNQSLSTEE